MLDAVRQELRKPVAWGAVLLTYVGIIIAVSYAASVGATSADAIRAEQARADHALMVQADQAQRAIVASGRIAIKSGCQFDNQRSGELKRILLRSRSNLKALRRRGALTDQLYRHQIRIVERDIRDISTRDCEAAANVLTDQPKETP